MIHQVKAVILIMNWDGFILLVMGFAGTRDIKS